MLVFVGLKPESMRSAKGAISKPVGSTARAFFFSTITILRICMSLSVTFSLPITRTVKFTSFSDDKLGSRQSRYVYFWMHAQFNRKSGIFGLPIGVFSGRSFRTAEQRNEDTGYEGAKDSKKISSSKFRVKQCLSGECEKRIHYLLSINEF